MVYLSVSIPKQAAAMFVYTRWKAYNLSTVLKARDIYLISFKEMATMNKVYIYLSTMIYATT